jgi:hypothetical protein
MMESSIFIARILGPCFMVIAAGIMFNRKFYQQVMEDYSKNTALVFFGGVLALVIGIVIVLNHNVWGASWPVVITVYGWGGIIKGIWLIVFPNSVYKFTRAYNKHPGLLSVHSVIILLIGLVLTYLAYLAGLNWNWTCPLS